MKERSRKMRIIERVVDGMGSVRSLIIHTIVFAAFFLSAALGFISLDSMLLILTTIVSLEAIYLSLLIQMTVNENTKSLREVEEDIEDIQEDVEELGEDIEDIQEDIEGISEDIDEIQEDVEEISEDLDEIQEDVEEMSEEDKAEEKREQESVDQLERLTADVRKILADLEGLKKAK